MTRLALILLLAAQDRPPDIPALIVQLGDDDIEVRSRAESALISRGSTALPALQAATRSTDLDVADRARRIRATIAPLRIVLGGGSVPSFGKKETVEVVLQIENPSGEERCYFATGFSLSVEVMELHEKPPQEGRRIVARGTGTYSTGCFLSSLDFLTVAPSGSHRRGMGALHEERGLEYSPAVLEKYPDISLTSPVLAGRYRMTARYAYVRDSYLALCPRSCAGHDDSRALWNRASTVRLEASAEFTLR
jgi:hypothetical protein